MLVKVDNLRIAFRIGEEWSVPVRDVSFAIGEGARVALVGESGSGKSLTARALGGLVDRAEISGQIVGRPKIAYIFQNPADCLDPVMKIAAQIAEALPGLGRRAARERVRELLARVDLKPEIADRYPCELSGGQQQRVLIAMALAAEPELLIADEPTTALDVTVQKDVLALIRTLADARGMALLMITHNLALVPGLCDEVCVMYAGEIVERGNSAALLSAPRHPYTRALLAAIPRFDAPKDAPLADIPGTVPAPTAWPVGCAFNPRCPFAAAACRSAVFRNGDCPQMK